MKNNCQIGRWNFKKLPGPEVERFLKPVEIRPGSEARGCF